MRRLERHFSPWALAVLLVFSVALIVFEFEDLAVLELASRATLMSSSTAFSPQTEAGAGPNALDGDRPSLSSSFAMSPLSSDSDAGAGPANLRLHRIPRVRTPIVYIYDWWDYCHRALGLCANESMAASRELACREARTALADKMAVKGGFVHIVEPALCDSYDEYGQVKVQREDFVEANTLQWNTARLYDSRLLRSAWRTYDPEEATLFYIAYDPLLDLFELATGFYWRRRRLATVAKAPSTKATNSPVTKSPGTKAPSNPFRNFVPSRANNSLKFSAAKLDWVLNITQGPWYKRRNGRDHFLVTGLHRAGSIFAPALVDMVLANATKLNLEGFFYPDSHYDELGRSQHYSRHTRRVTITGQTVPPSYLHPTKFYELGKSDACSLYASAKDVLIAMAFSSDLGDTKEAMERARPRRDLLTACNTLANASLCSSVVLQHGADKDFYAQTIDLYKRSKYCVVPVGDTVTSKRFFDVVQSCCIPVVAASRIADWLRLLRFPPIHSRIKALALFELEEPINNRSLEFLLEDNGRAFAGNITTLQRNMFGLSFAMEDHPTLFDAVDHIVAELGREGAILRPLGNQSTASAS